MKLKPNKHCAIFMQLELSGNSKGEAEQRTAKVVWFGRVQCVHSSNFSTSPMQTLPSPPFLHHLQLHRKIKKDVRVEGWYDRSQKDHTSMHAHTHSKYTGNGLNKSSVKYLKPKKRSFTTNRTQKHVPSHQHLQYLQRVVQPPRLFSALQPETEAKTCFCQCESQSQDYSSSFSKQLSLV